MNALIGHTGFVGSSLMRSRKYSSTFNSRNISDMAGRSFETVTCCGVSAVKWLANKEPEQDRAQIKSLTDVLGNVEARRFILVSTVDVFDPPAQDDEDSIPPREKLHPYGLHRLELEDWVKKHFDVVNIVRLTGLFGEGLKKNVIFDLLTNNQVESINPAGVFQWYDVARLAGDLEKVVEEELELVHLATEPLPVSEIHRRFFSEVQVGPSSVGAKYDLWTKYATVFGGTGSYIQSAESVLSDLGAFVSSEREKQAK